MSTTPLSEQMILACIFTEIFYGKDIVNFNLQLFEQIHFYFSFLYIIDFFAKNLTMSF